MFACRSAASCSVEGRRAAEGLLGCVAWSWTSKPVALPGTQVAHGRVAENDADEIIAAGRTCRAAWCTSWIPDAAPRPEGSRRG